MVLFHAFPKSWLTGGFVGVDVFFVISGFLITRILLREAGEGRLSVAAFYRRRVRRLLPALIPLLIFVLATAWALLTHADYRELALTAAATATFVANVAFYRLTGYFSGSAEDKPLLHMWSLAVEEQFYLLFPLFLLLAHRWFRAALPMVLAAGGLVSLGLAACFAESHPVAAFYLAPTRAYELVVGCMTALLADRSARLPIAVREGLSLAGLSIVVGSVVTFTAAMPFPGAIALIPCVGAALVIFCGIDARPIGSRLIGGAPFRFLGDISYSLYLWHWPLLCFARQWALGDVAPTATALVLVASVLLATLSWLVIERPFLKGLVRLPAVKLGLAATAAVVAVSGAIWIAGGFPQRFGPESRAMFAARDEYSRAGRRCLYSSGAPIPYARNCVFGAPGAAPSVAVWADSQGVELAVALGERLAPDGEAAIQITASGCPPVLAYRDRHHPHCAEHNANTLARLRADPRIRHVVLAANFRGYEGSIPPSQMDEGFGAAVRGLRRSGKRVTLVEPIPVFSYDPPKALGLSVERGWDPAKWGLPRAVHEAQNARLLKTISGLSRATGAERVQSAEVFCDVRHCPAYARPDGVLYFDEHHLSLAGARRLAAAVLPR